MTLTLTLITAADAAAAAHNGHAKPWLHALIFLSKMFSEFLEGSSDGRRLADRQK